MSAFPLGSFLFWLKLASVSITTGLAVVGLLHDFRDKETGSLTPWGRINFAGIIVSFLVGVAAQAIDQQRQTDASNDARIRMEGLTTKSDDLLQKATDLIDKNNVILRTTNKSLNSERKIYSATKETLTAANRELEPAGNTIKVLYSIRISMKNGNRGQTADDFHKRIDKFIRDHNLDSGPHLISFTDQGVGVWAPGDAKTATFKFDGHSQIVAGTSWLTHVPFSISFGKGKPLFKREENREHAHGNFSPARSYEFSKADTEAEDEAASKGEGQVPFVSGTTYSPVMIYKAADDVITQMAWDKAVFQHKEEGRPPIDEIHRVLDFGGLYVLVRSSVPQPVQFCEFDIYFGSRWISLPLADEDTDSGVVRYRLPKNMTQSAKEVTSYRRALSKKCIVNE
jgi:hypothetical protein